MPLLCAEQTLVPPAHEAGAAGNGREAPPPASDRFLSNELQASLFAAVSCGLGLLISCHMWGPGGRSAGMPRFTNVL